MTGQINNRRLITNNGMIMSRAGARFLVQNSQKNNNMVNEGGRLIQW